jgi:hypothetical protein
MKENNTHGGMKTSVMPSKLSTLVLKIPSLANPTNAKIIDRFYQYMKENGATEKHMANELQTVLYYATFLGLHNYLLDINKRELVLTFLNTEQKNEDILFVNECFAIGASPNIKQTNDWLEKLFVNS